MSCPKFTLGKLSEILNTLTKEITLELVSINAVFSQDSGVG